MGGALAFFGYFFLGIGPGIVFFFFIIAPKSFLVLLSFCSTFYWLLTLLIISCIFRGFLPFTASVGSYAGVLVASVAMQEAARYALWRGHELTTRVLDSHSRSTGHRFDVIDKLYLALGWGYGHGAAHVIFFSLSFITITTGDGTWYYDQCPSMSIFLAGSLYALAFGMLLPSLMVIAFEGYQQKHLTHVIYAPVVHMAASLLTLLNFSRNGCNIVMPLLLAIGVGNVVYAGQVCWRKGPHVPSVPLRRLSVDAPNPNTGDDNEDTHSHAELVTGMGPDSANDPAGGNGGAGGAARRRARQPAGSQWPVIGTA